MVKLWTVSQMDKVTQQNAANAEESASASEEMNAQAAQMKEMVQELVKLVGASKTRIPPSPPSYSSDVRQISANLSGPGSGRQMLKDRSREVRPEQAIPFDDDFKDF